jgi:hypothetical protein
VTAESTRRTPRTRAICALGVLCVLGVPSALRIGAIANAQGRLSNARTETRSAAQGLEREVRAITARGGVVWFGYRVPMVSGPRQMCCYDTISNSGDVCCGSCRLESGSGVSMNTGDSTSVRGSRVMLEPATEFLVLARVEAARSIVSGRCRLRRRRRRSLRRLADA